MIRYLIDLFSYRLSFLSLYLNHSFINYELIFVILLNKLLFHWLEYSQKISFLSIFQLIINYLFSKVMITITFWLLIYIRVQ